MYMVVTWDYIVYRYIKSSHEIIKNLVTVVLYLYHFITEGRNLSLFLPPCRFLILPPFSSHLSSMSLSLPSLLTPPPPPPLLFPLPRQFPSSSLLLLSPSPTHPLVSSSPPSPSPLPFLSPSPHIFPSPPMVSQSPLLLLIKLREIGCPITLEGSGSLLSSPLLLSPPLWSPLCSLNVLCFALLSSPLTFSPFSCLPFLFHHILFFHCVWPASLGEGPLGRKVCVYVSAHVCVYVHAHTSLYVSGARGGGGGGLRSRLVRTAAGGSW